MLLLGLDIGGTFIKYALIHEDASIKLHGKVPTPDCWEGFQAALTELIQKYSSQIKGICVCCPGLIDVNSGVVYYGGHLHYLHLRNLKEELNRISGLPVEIENDAKCAGLAEATLGNASAYQDSITLVLGTGIGGALIHDKKVLHGKHLMAGEFSWIISDMEKRYELHPEKHTLFFHEASTLAMVEKVAVRSGKPPESVTGELVFQWAQEGDPISCKVVDEFYRNLAVQLANLQHIYDPEIICIGGGVSQREELLPTLRRYVDDVYTTYALRMEKPQLVVCRFQSEATLVGALCHYMQRHPLKEELA